MTSMGINKKISSNTAIIKSNNLFIFKERKPLSELDQSYAYLFVPICPAP
jgi:hypothetical protein